MELNKQDQHSSFKISVYSKDVINNTFCFIIHETIIVVEIRHIRKSSTYTELLLKYSSDKYVYPVHKILSHGTPL